MAHPGCVCAPLIVVGAVLAAGIAPLEAVLLTVFFAALNAGIARTASPCNRDRGEILRLRQMRSQNEKSEKRHHHMAHKCVLYEASSPRHWISRRTRSGAAIGA